MQSVSKKAFLNDHIKSSNVQESKKYTDFTAEARAKITLIRFGAKIWANNRLSRVYTCRTREREGGAAAKSESGRVFVHHPQQ
jgi:hypothetical protein